MRSRLGPAVGVLLVVLISSVAASSLDGPADRVAGPTSHAATIALGIAHRAVALPRVALTRPPPAARGTRRVVLHWRADGVPREVVEVAPAHPASGAIGLVVVLHGRRQTPWWAERTERWDALAAEGQAVVAYGAGYAGSWNAGWCCGKAAAHRLDDVGFVSRILRVEEQRHRVDRRRLFLVGFSNGGMLAFRFACLHPTAISAFAVVAGTLETTSCRPTRPLGVLDVEGDRDDVVPYDGSSYSPVAGAPTTPVRDALLPWLRIGGGVAVRLVRLPGVGHEWPTRQHGGWDATREIWDFLLAHASAAA